MLSCIILLVVVQVCVDKQRVERCAMERARSQLDTHFCRVLLPSLRSLALSGGYSGPSISRTLTWTDLQDRLFAQPPMLKSRSTSDKVPLLFLPPLVSSLHIIASFETVSPCAEPPVGRSQTTRQTLQRFVFLFVCPQKQHHPQAMEPRLRYQLCKQSDGMSLLRC